MSDFDPVECARLIAVVRSEAMEDDDVDTEALADQLEAAVAKVAKLTEERDGMRTEIERLSRETERLADEDTERYRLRRAVEVVCRIAELDKVCEEHPGNADAIGNAAETELYDLVAERMRLLDAYRAAKEKP